MGMGVCVCGWVGGWVGRLDVYAHVEDGLSVCVLNPHNHI